MRFLPDYAGPHASILTRILQEDRDRLARDILVTKRVSGEHDAREFFLLIHERVAP
jgi:hypothetical protein